MIIRSPPNRQRNVSHHGKENCRCIHGFISCGTTVQEALFYCYHLELACKTQISALSSNAELIIPSHDICKQTCKDILSFEKNLGERDWEAWVRLLV